MKGILSAFVAWHVNVIHGGGHGKILKRHFKPNVRPCQPVVPGHPRVLLFPLLMVCKGLFKEAVMVI